jgi:hypothetical protein
MRKEEVVLMSPGSPKVFWIVAILFTGVGLVFSLILPAVLLPAMSGFDSPQPAVGTVVATRAESGVEEVTGATRVRFTDEIGRPHEFTTSLDAEKAGLRKGDRVEVVYNRFRPECAELRLYLDGKSKEAQEVMLVLKILGYIFLTLGLLVFVPLVAGLHVGKHHPEKLPALYWWINFLGGLMGALAFALPSSLALPGLYLAYLRRPNMLFEGGDTFGSTHLMLGIIFSALGVLVLVALWFVARWQLRGRPRA